MHIREDLNRDDEVDTLVCKAQRDRIAFANFYAMAELLVVHTRLCAGHHMCTRVNPDDSPAGRDFTCELASEMTDAATDV